jgi:hypothetical protein
MYFTFPLPKIIAFSNVSKKNYLKITTVMISLKIINEETFDDRDRRDGLVCENTMLNPFDDVHNHAVPLSD